ncbi:hypothetical protein Pcinc_025333 [Petrolisthes cinctipes]|uniref:Rhodanese domain-containing protein n=1 Tax=Petrolisthes cinctipes TaxID=88211 RepID=A0AAE1KBR2_PETCI|nr:hypothetical protein Pcinc_025333 [Petrolisthes cinctipes]
MEEITFDELATHLDNVTVIDVRNRNELEVCGQIPGSHCIPVTEIKYACDMEGDKFRERYGFDKPSPDDALVVCCRTGVRSKTACDLLQAKGFKRHRIYRGSFSEWEEKGGEVLKPGHPYEYDFEDDDNDDDDEYDQQQQQQQQQHHHCQHHCQQQQQQPQQQQQQPQQQQQQPQQQQQQQQRDRGQDCQQVDAVISSTTGQHGVTLSASTPPHPLYTSENFPRFPYSPNQSVSLLPSSSSTVMGSASKLREKLEEISADVLSSVDRRNYRCEPVCDEVLVPACLEECARRGQIRILCRLICYSIEVTCCACHKSCYSPFSQCYMDCPELDAACKDTCITLVTTCCQKEEEMINDSTENKKL